MWKNVVNFNTRVTKPLNAGQWTFTIDKSQNKYVLVIEMNERGGTFINTLVCWVHGIGPANGQHYV